MNGTAIQGHVENGRASLPPRDEFRGGEINARIVSVNNEASERYIEESDARRRYWALHPTYMAVMKCMDGRVHLPSMTLTPFGLIKPFRAIGGAFRPSWPAFRKRLDAFAKEASKHGKRNLALVSYHYSGSDPHLGCAGWAYDTKSARQHATWLADQLQYMFGEQMDCLVLGAETDTDTLILHGHSRDVSGANFPQGVDEDDVRIEIARAFPRLNAQTAKDIAPLLVGNARRIRDLRETPRDLRQVRHGERIIAIGQGFDWLAAANLALIVNDFDPNLDAAVVTAGKIIAQNMGLLPEHMATLHPDEDVTIFTNITYREPGREERMAEVSSKDLMHFSLKHLREQLPSLIASGRVRFMIGKTDERTRKLTVIDQGRVSP